MFCYLTEPEISEHHKKEKKKFSLKTKNLSTSTFELSRAKNQSALVPRPYSCITHSARADRSFPRPTSIRPAQNPAVFKHNMETIRPIGMKNAIILDNKEHWHRRGMKQTS